jgi:hypothetical protein
VSGFFVGEATMYRDCFFEVIMSKMAESIDFKNIGYLQLSFTEAELAPIRAEVAKSASPLRPYPSI